MSDTRNDAHDSIDTSPLTLEQLSDDELITILSIEHQLTVRQTRDSANATNKKPYLAPVQVRRPQVLLLDGARGTGKTSLLLTMAHRWNIRDGCEVKRHDSDEAQYEARVRGVADRLHFEPTYTIPTRIHPLRILDFDPLPPQMPLVAGIIQAWQPLAQKYDELSGRREEQCDSEVETLEDAWTNLFRVGTVGWSAMPTAAGLLEQVLDRQEQVFEWQRLGQRWYEFVRKVIACGKCLRDPHKFLCEPVFVIMIDDVDLQVERIRELLPALRLLYHPNVAFLVAAHWEHLIDTLGMDFLGRQNRLANLLVDSDILTVAKHDRWAGTLALAAATKVFPLKNRWQLTRLTLHELLAFPNYGDSSDKPKKRDANAGGTMRTILNKWPRVREKKELGDYLHDMAGSQNDPYEIPPFITYRDAHQIFDSASMQGDERAKATEAVRLLISAPGSDAVKLEKAKESEPIVEYRGVGQLAALFPPDYVEETSASSGTVLSARPGFIYRKQPGSDAISMHGYVGTEVNFAAAMLAVTLQDGHYGVAVPGLQWNVRLALVWTRVEVSDTSSFHKLAFQWRFHKHPHPFELLKWSRKWLEFVRTFQESPKQRLERIAYAWIFYQLVWLKTEMNDVPSPVDTEDLEKHWGPLLALIPPVAKDGKPKWWETQEWQTRTWRTQTLPLLARPEIGLAPAVQNRLLQFVSGNNDQKDRDERRRWLRDQRRRLVTDAVIAAAGANGHRADNAEDVKQVEAIVQALNARYRAAYDNDCPWLKSIED